MVDIVSMIAQPNIPDFTGELRKQRQFEQNMGLMALQQQQARAQLQLAEQLDPLRVEQAQLNIDATRREQQLADQTRNLLGAALQGDQKAFSQLASVNPDAYSKVFKFQTDVQDRAKKIGKENTAKVSNLLTTIVTAPDDQKAGLYQAAKSQLEALSGEDFPETYSEELLPGFQLMANSTRDIEKIFETPVTGAQQEAEVGPMGLTGKAYEEYQKAMGKDIAEKTASYRSQKAKLPQLQKTVGKLRDLAEVATYTMAGRLTDTALKELGFGSTKGADARKQYISIVDNQILPLLRDTFGAAFTAKEGESLRATLGDPDATPDEKQLVLDSFINQKVSNLEALGSELGLEALTQSTPVEQLISTPVGEFSLEELKAERERRGL